MAERQPYSTWSLDEVKRVFAGREAEDPLFGKTVNVCFGQEPNVRSVELSYEIGAMQIRDPEFGFHQYAVGEVCVIGQDGLLFVLADGKRKGYVSADYFLPPSDTGLPPAAQEVLASVDRADSPSPPTSASPAEVELTPALQESVRFLGPWAQALDRKRRGIEFEPVERVRGRVESRPEFYNSRGLRPTAEEYVEDRARFTFVDNEDPSGETIVVNVGGRQIANLHKLNLRIGEAVNIARGYRKVDLVDPRGKSYPLPQKRVWALAINRHLEDDETAND